ncbi:hypothetical protein [Methylicorpusculum sp.]|uniref:hypothetical protein n=1 Tax=Methylicorpusculum sp. TaxID=2713644 RepID=UPI00273196AE|nr:hypothetical protein [Methylicorpusculum sp.]MDZ4152896.1 hypothetical protein [Methylicorpusculum sp.]
MLAKLVTSQNKKRKNVYGSMCGSASLLLRVKKEVAQHYKIKIWTGTIDYGQSQPQQALETTTSRSSGAIRWR